MVGIWVLPPQEDYGVLAMSQGMALCGATFFCALFFNNAGEIRPPDCKWCEQEEGMEVCEPLYPDWVKMTVSGIIGAMKASVVAVLLVLFKRAQVYQELTVEQKKAYVQKWLMKEKCSSSLASCTRRAPASSSSAS